jgi:hypothetical protein
MEMELWQKVLLGVGAILIVLWFRPGIKAIWKQSQEAENKDWKGLFLPIGMVVLFVILLIVMVRS